MQEQKTYDTLKVDQMAGELRVTLSKLKRRLRGEAHPGDFTLSQLSVLSRLETEGPATVSTLARAEAVRPQSMGATIAALEAAGLVSGTPDSKDRRQTILSVTDACRNWIQASRAAKEDWLSRAIRTQLTPVEQTTLADALELLKRIADS